MTVHDLFSIDLSLAELALLAAAGLVCGIINTLAGSGSLITLPVFIFICGLPAPVANGTNRIGVLLQTLVGAYGFYRKGATPVAGTAWLIVACIAGALAGSRIAVQLDERIMNGVLGGLMVFMLGVLLLKPERWLRATAADPRRNRRPLTLFVFFLIGIYGGFIQAGVGIFLLAGLVLAGRYSLGAANGIKNLLVFAFTLPALLVFLWYGQVHIGYGLLMAVFQSAGAWLGVRLATSVPNAERWMYRLLVAAVAVSALKFFV